MARAITMKKDLPGYAIDNVERTEALGFGWRFIEEQILADKHVQVRDTKFLAPPREVAQYAQALKRGDLMPPVIQTKDRYLVDGNTRTEAARKLGWNTFPTIQLDVNYEGAPEPIRRQIIALGTAFNLTHGRGLSQANIIALIEQVADPDDRPVDVATKLHIPVSTVTMAMNAKKARDRAEKLGVTLLPGVLTGSHLKMFGQKSGKFTGPVFAEMISLAQAARMTTTQTNDLARQVEAADTESDRLLVLARLKGEYGDTIEAYRTGTAPRPTPTKSGKLRRSLGFLNNEDLDDLLEIDVKESSKHLRVLELSKEKINKLYDRQLAIETERHERV